MSLLTPVHVMPCFGFLYSEG